jgi:hypothetical protein
MRVDLALPAPEKMMVVLEAIGDEKIRVNSSSLDNPIVILHDRSLEIGGSRRRSWSAGRRARVSG